MTQTPDRDVLERSAPEPDRTESYGPAGHQVYDVYAGSGRGWLILLHGGFWRAEWDRTHLRPLAAALAGQGYDVALVEYARSGMPGGGWPRTGADVAAAVTVIRAQEVGTDPVVLVGHSAGGHLAVWALHQTAADGVRGAVSLAGCIDVHLVAELGLDDDAARELMATSPTKDPDAWTAADPARLGPTPYPVVVLHGTTDEEVPLAVTRSWWDRAATPGRDELVLLEDVGHYPLIDPDAPAHQDLVEAVERLVRAPR